MFALTISSELYGDTIGVGHDVDEHGILVDMCYVPPYGTVVLVTFVNEADPQAAMTARARSLGRLGESVLLQFLTFEGRAADQAASS